MLMESPFYFDLRPRERLVLVQQNPAAIFHKG